MLATWETDPVTGTLRHRQTGTTISPDTGITVQGKEYSLNVKDIQLDHEERLGFGAGGSVIKGTIVTTGQRIAVKTVNFDDKGKRDQLLNDIKGLVAAETCPYLVQWYAGFVSKKSNTVHVALELMDLGSLRDLHKRARGNQVPPDMLANITFQVLMGLQHLFSKHLLHRDIKPENILHNTDGQVKLADFGIAKSLEDTLAAAGTFVGTTIYMSPERCIGETYNYSADIWSVGLVLHELATGKYPFADCSSFPALYEALCEKPEPRLDPGLFPPDLCDFTSLCLTRDLARRPDTEALLAHPFVTKDVVPNEALAAYLATLM